MAETDRYNQLVAWIEGRSEHNKVDDECCPDFSCCVPALLVDRETRLTFFKAAMDDMESEVVFHMLGMFLSALLVHHGMCAYVAGDHSTEQ